MEPSGRHTLCNRRANSKEWLNSKINPLNDTLLLRAIGVRVSVDDFGTGHSSLAYLRQFPLHSLKVDRSFVRGIEGSRDMASIVSAVTTMAQQLGLRVVAELDGPIDALHRRRLGVLAADELRTLIGLLARLREAE